MLTWSDDVAAGDTLIGHVFTVYSGDTPLRVLPTRVIGEKVVLVVAPPYKQSLTLSFAVSAVNRYGVSLPSDRSNTVTVAGRTANGSDASGSFAFDE